MPVLYPAVHDLDAVAAFVAALVIFDGDLALFSSGDAGAYPFVFQRFPEPTGIIDAISEQPIDARQAAEQRLRPDVIADLSG